MQLRIDHPEIRIENTSRCNAHCVTCPREKMTRAKIDMPMYHFKNLVDQAKGLGVGTVSIFGYGEPLLDDTIAARIRYCTDLGMETFITTNGSLLDIDVAKNLLDAGLKHIRFSVHAIRSADYERVHRKLSATDTFRNIGNFMAISRGRCKVHVTTMPLNGESVEDFKRCWDEVDCLEVWKPHNWASGRKFRKPDNSERVMCKRAFTGPIQILADGRMIVCCFDYDGVLTIGNTHDSKIVDILNDSLELRRYRKRHIEGNLTGLPCENCDQRFVYRESPLLYSSEQDDKELNKTFITKSDLSEERRAVCGTTCG